MRINRIPTRRSKRAAAGLWLFGHEEIRWRYETMFAELPAITIREVQSFTVGSYVVQEEEVIGREPEPERHVAIYRVGRG